MTEQQVTDLISSLAGDLGLIGTGVITLTVVAMAGLWIIRILRSQ